MRVERHLAFWVAAFLVLVGLLWLLHHVLLPFVAGAALAYMLDPLANLLTKRGMNRLVAALIILAGFVVVIAGVIVIVAPVLVGQLGAFLEKVPGYLQQLQSLISNSSNSWLKSIAGGAAAGDAQSTADLTRKVIEYVSGVLPTLWTKGTALLSLFSLLVITPVVTFYLLLDWDSVVASFDGLIPIRQRETVENLVREIDRALAGYLRGQMTVCVILGVYYAIGLTLAGLNFGILIGAVSGLLTFIPYVGSLTALVVSLCVALAQFYPDWTHILIIVGIVLVGQFLEGNVLSPKLVGESVGLHPVWLIFALLACGYLFGFVGLILAVPLAAAAGVLTRFALRRYRASPFYTGTGP